MSILKDHNYITSIILGVVITSIIFFWPAWTFSESVNCNKGTSQCTIGWPENCNYDTTGFPFVYILNGSCSNSDRFGMPVVVATTQFRPVGLGIDIIIWSIIIFLIYKFIYKGNV